MIIGDKIDNPDLITEPVWVGTNLSRTSEIGQRRAISPTRGGGVGTLVRQPLFVRRTAGWSSALSLPRVWWLELFSLNRCGGIRDTDPRFDLPGFDGGARPHPRPSDPKDGFPSFLVLSLRSFSGLVASGGGELVLATSPSSSSVRSKAGRYSSTMAANL
jgi:hypothetical protein